MQCVTLTISRRNFDQVCRYISEMLHGTILAFHSMTETGISIVIIYQ